MIADCRKCEGTGMIIKTHKDWDCSCSDVQEICPCCFGAGQFETVYRVESKDDPENYNLSFTTRENAEIALKSPNDEPLRISVFTQNHWDDKRSGN